MPDYTFHNIEQNSPEWYQLRCGRVGGSSMVKIMANYGRAFGEPAKGLAVKIALEQITGVKCDSSFTNAHMERGHEQEPIARALYEDENFCTVGNGGYFSVGDDVGVSPDGIVGDDGGIEIKSVIETVHYANKKRKDVDPAYKWQVIHELKITEREWWDFVSYCEAFPLGKQLFVHRVYAENFQEEFKMIDKRMDEFRKLVSEAKTVILS